MILGYSYDVFLVTIDDLRFCEIYTKIELVRVLYNCLVTRYQFISNNVFTLQYTQSPLGRYISNLVV